MTVFENATELFNKIVRDYEKQLKEASSEFQAAVMAAQHEMERRISEWNKSINPEDLTISGTD